MPETELTLEFEPIEICEHARLKRREVEATLMEAEIKSLRAALHHIAYQKPVSDVSLDWQEEWRGLRNEARKALEGEK